MVTPFTRRNFLKTSGAMAVSVAGGLLTVGCGGSDSGPDGTPALVNPYYTQAVHGPYERISIGRLELADGGVLPNCELAVATFGTLNADKSNAILVPTWYSGTSKIMEQVYVGPDHALDPSRYFIIIVNQIGNGLSTSPHNIGGALAGPNFPKVRISDDVRAQHRLLTEHFGIRSLALIFGGSMGAQQTYEWAVRYPDMVKRAAPLAGTACNTEHDFLFTKTLKDALTSDPGFERGLYDMPEDVAAGLGRHAKMWTVMGWSTEFFRLNRHRALGFDSVRAFVDGFMIPYFAPMDPNNLLTMAWKWQRGDVSLNTGGDKVAALGRIRAKVLVMPLSTDMFFPPSDCLAEQVLIPNSAFRPISTADGHLGLFGTDADAIAQIDRNLRELLATAA